MGSGMSKVVTGLYLGNIRDSEDRDSLRRHGVTHILSVHNGAKPVLEDMTYLCISASDSSSQNLMQHFKESIKFIHECRLRGGGCLVHWCHRGWKAPLPCSAASYGCPLLWGSHGDSAPSSHRASLAGVSRSTTILVAYLMTVTELGWERCLAATKAVRSYASPNFGFQQQLQEYEQTLLKEYRAWIRHDYGRNPFQDQEELQRLLAQQEQSGSREGSCTAPPAPTHPLPSSRSPWMDR